MQVVGKLAGLMSINVTIEKCVDLGVPIVTILINNIYVPNTSIDLGATINVMTIETMQKMNISNLRPAPTILEMADSSRAKPEGVVYNVIVSSASWEYHVGFVVIQPKYNLGGHPRILGRPWLETIDTLIRCRSWNMIISRGIESKHATLYPHARSITELEQMSWLEERDLEK